MTTTVVKHYGPDGKLLDITEASANQVKLTITGAGEHRFEVEIPENSPIKSVTLTRVPQGEPLIPGATPQAVNLTANTPRLFTYTPPAGTNFVNFSLAAPGLMEGEVEMLLQDSQGTMLTTANFDVETGAYVMRSGVSPSEVYSVSIRVTRDLNATVTTEPSTMGY